LRKRGAALGLQPLNPEHCLGAVDDRTPRQVVEIQSRPTLRGEQAGDLAEALRAEWHERGGFGYGNRTTAGTRRHTVAE
jgi:hypothetical protein